MAYVGLIDFAEALGVEFSMDWDGEVVMEYPDEIDAEKLVTFLGDNGKLLGNQFRTRCDLARRVFVGGPLNGQRTPLSCCRSRSYWAHRCKRARWAVYRMQADGRAFFVGYATSAAKAKRGEVCQPAAK